MALSEELFQILKKANAGFNFTDTGATIESDPINPVNPEDNETPESYIDVRQDEINSVLTNGKKIDFTNKFGNYLRLLMPQYARRVEIEDLNRNFWVISQVLSLLTKYLIKGLRTRRGIVVLPNSKDYDDAKYDNFDIIEDGYIVSSTTNWNNRVEQEKWEELIFDRLSYLKDIYSNDDLLILPVIRYNNYYQNYYRKELYLGLYEYTKETDESKFHWFYNGDYVQPIINEITGDKDIQIFHLNDDQEDLRFYWYFGYKDQDQSSASHKKAYMAALRGIPTFIDDNQLTIKIEDAIGKALVDVHGKTYYQEDYTINKVNGKYQWVRVITQSNCEMGESGDTSYTSATGFYLGELTSDRSLLEGISDYNLEINNYNLRPISPSLFEIRHMLDYPSTLNGIRGSIPDDENFKFLPLQSINGSPIKFYNILNCASNESENQGIIPYGNGKEGNVYDTYKHQEDGRKVLTQHGEDRAILDLMTEKLTNEVDRTNKKVKLHLFNHALLLQKAEGGTVQGKSDELKDVYTATLKDGTPVLQIAPSRDTDYSSKESYLVYEYDGYLTGTSSNTGGYDTAQPNTQFKGRFGSTVNKDIDHATPRRDNIHGKDYSYFKNWPLQGTPYELIAIDNGAIAATPYDFIGDSGYRPRFSNGLEKYTYGAILEIPWSSSENRCYAFEYNLFENALQDSYGFWRGKFYVNKINDEYSVGNESYGRWHKVYTNAQYFQNNNNTEDMIIKITNIGITFGPQLNTYYNGSNFTKPDNNNTINIQNLPNEYKDGKRPVTEEMEHFISYQKNQPYSYYFNAFETPKHISPLAPLYAYGWPVKSTTQTPVVWKYSSANSFETISTDLLPIEKFTINKEIIDYLDNTEGALTNKQYLPLVTKGNTYSKRGYTGSILPIRGGNTEIFNCQGLKDALDDVRISESYPCEVNLFTKLLGDDTLNEGHRLDDSQFKFYGFTTLVHTVYVKINLKQSNDCQYSISNLKRIKMDYTPIIGNNQLRWEKSWTPGITDINDNQLNQAQIEDLISANYILKQSVGDFTSTESEAPNKVVFDFSKYPSNGMSSIQNIDPTPETIFNTNNGGLAPTTVPQVDMAIKVEIPNGSDHYGQEENTISDYQTDLVLTGDAITSGIIKLVDSNYYIILKYLTIDVTTGEALITNGQYKYQIPQSWDNKITITASHNGYNTITKTITVSNDVVFEQPEET